MTEDELQKQRQSAQAAVLSSLVLSTKQHDQMVRDGGNWLKSAEAIERLANAYAVLVAPRRV